MTFAHPSFLWLLLVVPPAMMAFFAWSRRVRQKLMTQFIQARLLPGLVKGVSPGREKIRWACLTLAVACLIVALAQPRWGFDWEEIKQRGLDIVVAIDTSKSMLAADIAPNRLARAKLAALDLMQQAKSDRLGLVAFAGTAYLECPLTVDDTAFRQSVEALDVNTIPEGGTAIASSIETALSAFKEGDNYKVLVLFTDGEDHDSGALDAAKQAAQQGLRIFTIGIGTVDGEILRVQEPNGQSEYIRDEQGNVVKSHLNETLLQEIAGAASGFYLPLRGADTIDMLYARGLAPLPKSEAKEKLVRRYRERYHWPLAAAILLLLSETFFPERKRETKNTRNSRPSSGPLPPGEKAGVGLQPPGATERSGDGSTATPPPIPPAASGAGTSQRDVPAKVGFVGNIQLLFRPAIAALVLLVLSGTAHASPSSASKDYHAKNYAAAQKEYERLAEEDKTGDLRLTFNAGAAAYQATNYDAAIKHFTSALAARDVKLQQAAYFNLGNTQYRLGEAADNLDGMQELWETAIKSYQNALALDKNDADATHNLALVKNYVEQIIQLREAARRAKEAADDATRRRNYHRALEIMESLMQSNPTAKQFQDFTKKLKDIDEIVTTPQP
jgi:Ca-activated chloride channel family protein